jgi:hypothetical protein
MTDKPNLTRVWAGTAPGGNVVDPDTVTAGKFAAGWQAEVPPFEYFNFIQKQITEGLAHINEQGIAVWDDLTTYPVGGLAKGSDGNLYKALVSQNDNDPVSDSGTNWIDWEASNRVIRVTSVSSLKILTATNGEAAYLTKRAIENDNGGGNFVFDSSDLSAKLVTLSSTSQSVNSTSNVITDTAHGLSNGDGVTVELSVNGLGGNELYWVVNRADDTYQLSETYGGSPVSLTGTTNFTAKRLLDPLMGVYVSNDRLGKDGAWVREYKDGIYVDWFGAVADASMPNLGNETVSSVANGTDSTLGFKACRQFAGDLATNSALIFGEADAPIRMKAGGSYKVIGDGILGNDRALEFLAGDSLSVIGNSAQIYWQVTSQTDRFFHNMQASDQVVTRDFTIYMLGFNSAVDGGWGIFWEYAASATTANIGAYTRQPEFTNVTVYGGLEHPVYPVAAGNYCYRMFQITGYGYGDRITTHNCGFRFFKTFFYSQNPEAVSPKINTSTIHSKTTNAVFFDFPNHYGGCTVFETDLLMKGDTQTLIRAVKDGAYPPFDKIFHFLDCRVETNDENFNIFQADYGHAIFENLDFQNGASTITAASQTALLSSSARCTFIRCTGLPGNIRVITPFDKTDKYNAKFIDCSFFRVPSITVRDGTNFYNIKEALSNGVGLPFVQILGSESNPEVIYPGLGTSGKETEFLYGNLDISNGYKYLSGGAFLLPPFIIIESIEVFSKATPTFQVEMSIGSYSVVIPLSSSSPIKTQIVTGSDFGISIPTDDAAERLLSFEFQDSGGNIAGRAVSFAKIKYRGASSFSDMASGSLTVMI